MKRLACFSALVLVFLCTSCAVTMERHSYIHEKDLEVTLDDGCEETELLSVDHEDTPDYGSFRLAMPFLGINVFHDRWTGEKYIDIDLFR
jgi:hypothetical protein